MRDNDSLTLLMDAVADMRHAQKEYFRCAMCAECNLGIGREPVTLRLMCAILLARVNGTEEDQS